MSVYTEWFAERGLQEKLRKWTMINVGLNLPKTEYMKTAIYQGYKMSSNVLSFHMIITLRNPRDSASRYITLAVFKMT
jgi:hypothetical protein